MTDPTIPTETPAPSTPPPAPPVPATAKLGLPKYLQAWDMLLVAGALALAFLLASFAVRNSDFWQHLAAGRLVATGENSFGKDPFSYSQPDKYWVNNSWMHDFGSFKIFDKAGGKALVMLKAMLVAAAAMMVMAVARKGQSLFPYAVCAGLAALVAGPRLVFNPWVWSIFFTASTMLLLIRQPKGLPILIGVSFALWSNLDQWFFLGPLFVLLYLVGEVLAGRGRQTGIALAVGIVACNLNPHTFHVWQLPAELVSEALRENIMTQREVKGIFDGGVFSLELSSGLVPQTIAFFGLFALLVVGFLANLRRLHVGQLLIAVAVFGMAVRYAGILPFLAFAWAPIAAWQWATAGQRLADAELRPAVRSNLHGLRIMGRLGATAAVAGLMFLAWPGWLHPEWQIPERARRVAWEVEANPGLERAALQLNAWRKSGDLPEGARCFNMTPDLAHYGAWFAPGERFHYDTRYTFHKDTVEDFSKARQAFLQQGERLIDGKADAFDLRKFLDDNKIAFVAWTNTNRGSYIGMFNRLLRAPNPKTADDSPALELWNVAGRVAFLGWKESKALPADRAAKLRFDPVRLAFNPNAASVPQAEPVPPPRPLDFWEMYFQVPRGEPASTDEAAALVEYQLVRMDQLRDRTNRNFGGLVALAGPLAIALAFQPLAVPDEFAATGVLAARAARRAVAENPDLPDPYMYMARAFTPEEGGFGTSDSLRRLVVSTAYHRAMRRTSAEVQAVRRSVPLFLAALRLMEMHVERQEFDLAYEAYQALLRSFRPEETPGIKPEEFNKQYEQFKNLKWPIPNGRQTVQVSPDDFIRKVEERYENGTPKDAGPLVRAQAARQLGLVLEATKMLKTADFAKLPPQESAAAFGALVDFLIAAGNVEEAYQMLSEVERYDERLAGAEAQALLAPRYVTAWYLMGELENAARGQFDNLSRNLQMAARQLPKGLLFPSVEAANIALALAPHDFNDLLRGRFFQAFGEQLRDVQDEGETLAEIGFIHLEQGKNIEARNFLTQCLKPRGYDVNFPSKPLAKKYLELLEKAK